MATSTQPTEEEDASSLTILEHLQEARRRMMYCAIALLPAAVIGFFLSDPFMEFLKEPAEQRMDNFNLIFTQVLENWIMRFRVTMMLAFTFAMPFIVFQIFAFVGPGLTNQEKKWLYPIALAAGVMFFLGMMFAYYVGLPPALGFLLDGRGVAEPFITLRDYISFTTRFMFIAGLVFETPLIVMGLAKIGLVNSRKLLSWWRYAIIGSFVLAAIVTPSIDPITQTLFAVPMIVFYFVGIFLARLVESSPIIPKT